MQYVTIEKLRKIIVEELSQYDGAEPILLNIESEMLQKIFFTSNGCIYPILAPILSKVDFSNISFDGFDAYQCDFSNLNGVKINPQTIKNKNLELSTLAGVEFIGSFDDVKIEGANFTGSKGAQINPQRIEKLNLKNIIATDVEFIGSFEGTEIEGANFEGSNYQEIIEYEKSFRQKIKKQVYAKTYKDSFFDV